MGPYQLIVFVHVAAAVALLSGSVVGSPAVRAAVRRAQTLQELRAHLAIGRPLHVLEPVSALVLLASGIYLTSVAGFWGLGWVQVATVSWLMNAAIAVTMVKPAIKAVAEQAAIAPDGPVGHPLDALRWSRSWSIGGNLLPANDAAMLWLMTMQPDLVGSLSVVAVALLVIVGAGAMRDHLHHTPVRPPATVGTSGGI
jgi:uncharacterized membrane protein